MAQPSVRDPANRRSKRSDRDSDRPPPVAERKGRPLSQRLAPYAFLTPNMTIFLLFSIWPALYSFYVSLFSTSPFRPPEFVGLGNYAELGRDDLFRQALMNSFVYVTAFTFLVTVLSVVLAVLLNQQIRAKGFLRGAFFLPVLLSPAVVGLVWRWILQRDVGLLNVVLNALGIPPQPWLLDGTLAMTAIISVGLWIHLGFFAMIVLAGLQSIDPVLYEAADVDGASTWAQFRHVTLPLLGPTIMVVLILSVISGFKAFDYIFVLTGGGPVFSTTLLVQYIYRVGFDQVQFGLGAAASVVLFLVVFTLTLGQFVLGRRREAI